MKHVTLLVFGLLTLLLVSCQSQVETTSTKIIETGVDPEAWVHIPAGEFLMGQHDHETAVDYDYEIMNTDVTNEQ